MTSPIELKSMERTKIYIYIYRERERERGIFHSKDRKHKRGRRKERMKTGRKKREEKVKESSFEFEGRLRKKRTDCFMTVPSVPDFFLSFFLFLSFSSLHKIALVHLVS